MPFYRTIPWLMVGLLLGLAACTSPSKDSTRPVSTGGVPEKGGKLLFLDPELQTMLKVVQKPKSVRVYDDHLEVETALRNTSTHDVVYLSVQTVYWDAEGAMLYDVPGFSPEWNQIMISPGQTVHYKNESLTHHAVDYSIRIRHNRPGTFSMP